MPDFKVGDVVRLKSGSPSMTITSIGESGMMGGGPIHAYVTWFNEKREVKTDSFPLPTIEHYET
jgi:uncharacterized protein YodC (DUF2158 family)